MSKDLENEIKKTGTDVTYLGDFSSIENYLKNNLNNNDMLITMGAGNIDSICDSLVKK